MLDGDEGGDRDHTMMVAGFPVQVVGIDVTAVGGEDVVEFEGGYVVVVDKD